MNMVLPSTRYSLLARSRRGQAVLSLTLLIGGIIVLVALALAFLATSFVNSAYGYAIAQRAQAAATSGAYDALMQLARDKDFGGVDPGTTYTIAVGSSTATVTVIQDSPAVGKVAITSTATITFRKRTVSAVAARDSTTGQITVISWMQT